MFMSSAIRRSVQMRLLHDPAVHAAIRARVEHLPPDAVPRWGKMSVDQMLWHCNEVLGTAVGDVKAESVPVPFPVPVIKFILFNLPWPHGAPTAPQYQAVERHAFETERAKCLELIDRFAAEPLDRDVWPRAVFGAMTGREWSRLQAKHLDHHLKQFSV
jgi:hypothetical protein